MSIFYLLSNKILKYLHHKIEEDKDHNYIPFFSLIISTTIFAIIYRYIVPKHFKHFNNEKMTLFNAFYLSTVNQTLLGSGDFLPLSTISKVFIICQVFITLLITLIASW